ncbi:MAG: 7-carboxy-7-deazaguanine synthase QueE [Geobacter sp.]|nr:7-carboxy-7-deazaguanine synthase QueE [Geobacter sp.]
MNKSAELIEVFSSVQGEGMLVGLRQAFIRFAGCNISCDYCDTGSLTAPKHCLMEATPGRRDFFPQANPVGLERIAMHLEGWCRGWPGVHHSISLTGGEPLLHHDALVEWLPRLRSILPIYLETNGVPHETLGTVIDNIDYISMDIKLPSTSGEADLWDCHQRFIEIAAHKELFVKVVVGETTQDWEVIRACEIIAAVGKNIPLIIQPMTGKDGSVTVSPIKVIELQETACRYLKEVRVIPQTHKFLGMI